MPLPSANSMDIKAEKEEDKKQKLFVILANSEMNEVLSQKRNRLASSLAPKT
jgi:hypothetical protein